MDENGCLGAVCVVVLPHEPAYPEARSPEVKQQTNRKTGCSQVVENLRLMLRCQLAQRLQLQEQRPLYQYIRNIIADHPTLVGHNQRLLSLELESLLSELDTKRIFINRLQEPRPKPVADLKGTPNNTARKRFLITPSPRPICVHLR
jgi:hypothetical protein